MTEDVIKAQANLLASLFCFLEDDRDTATYKVEDHNICSAVIEKNGLVSNPYMSYSNGSRISKKMRCEYEFIPDLKTDNKLINRGGMQDLHTEIRLLNYLHASGTLQGPCDIHLFSSRSVCPTCLSAIQELRYSLHSQGIQIFFYSLKAENGITDCVFDEFNNIYNYN